MSSPWIRVSKQAPCPVCEHDSWCCYLKDEKKKLVLCMRAKSDRINIGKDGTVGWLHQYQGELTIPNSIRVKPARLPKKPLDFDKILQKFPKITAVLADHEGYIWAHGPHGKMRYVQRPIGDDYSDEVDLDFYTSGMLANHLADSVFGYDYKIEGSQWVGFPMRDHTGKIIGLMRRYDSARKLAYTGSKMGLFYNPDLHARNNAAVICEGPTDTCTLLQFSVPAIGRPSCTGGITYLTELCKNKSQIIVLGENDAKPEKRGKHCPVTCKGCLFCWPGLAGAKLIAEQLSLNMKTEVALSMPPKFCKDARDWSQSKTKLSNMSIEQRIIGTYKKGKYYPVKKRELVHD